MMMFCQCRGCLAGEDCLNLDPTLPDQWRQKAQAAEDLYRTPAIPRIASVIAQMREETCAWGDDACCAQIEKWADELEAALRQGDAPVIHPRRDRLADAAEMLWVVLANVSGGDWTQQTPEWQEAAARWRDNYFAALKAADVLPVPANPTQEEETHATHSELPGTVSEVRDVLRSDYELRPPVQAEQEGRSQGVEGVSGLAAQLGVLRDQWRAASAAWHKSSDIPGAGFNAACFETCADELDALLAAPVLPGVLLPDVPNDVRIQMEGQPVRVYLPTDEQASERIMALEALLRRHEAAVAALRDQWRQRAIAPSIESPDSELTLQRCIDELDALLGRDSA